jgi:ABC-type sugar transport system substrate-binding protein
VNIVTGLVLATGLALSSPCVGQDMKGIVVGFSQIGSESGWRAAETAVTRQQAATRGIELKFADAQQKQENQIKAVRGFIAQGVDAIMIAPVVATGWDDVLAEAAEAEIPVLLLDRGVDAPPQYYLAFGSDRRGPRRRPVAG